MIELDSLKFSVDTSELVKAITEVGNLQKAVSNLNKPLAENARISAKAAKESAGVAIAEEKVAQAKAKTLAAESRATAAKERAEKATDRLIKKETEQISVLERQQNIYNFMTQGYSKGQATVLAQAKAQGALGDELERVGKILNDQRKLLGGDPFDKSISGLTSLRNAMRELKDEQRTFTAGIEMTSKQYKEFARDKLRIIEVAKAEGVSLSELKQRLRDHGAEYVKLTTEVNRLADAEKARERAQRDQLNATRSIAAEDEKMASIMKSLNAAQADHSSLSDRAARSIANYERNLRIAGITGEKAAAKLEQYRKSVTAVQQAEKQRQIDMLSRSLAPQISDVAVSLASGMNPLTVALQQGLQIRDLIGLSGVAVEDLQKSFKTAAADMVSSLAGTASALGSLFIGALNSAGKSVVEFASKITGTTFLLSKFREGVVGLVGESSKIVKFVDIFGKLFTISAGAMVFAAAASLIAFGVALKQVIQEEDALAKTLALSGGQLALSHDAAIQYAKSMRDVGVTTGDAIQVIGEMAKAGNLTAESIPMVTKAAVDMKTYAGVAIEDTVKAFSKMKDEPVKAIIELAKTTGMIQPAVINAVNALMQQGRTAEATSLAMKSLADVNSQQVERMKRDYSDFAMFMINISKGVRDFFSEIFKDLFYKADPDELAKKQLEALSDRIEEVRSNLKFNSLGGLLQTDNSLLKNLESQAASLRRQIESRAVVRSLAKQEQEEQNKVNASLSRAIGLEDTLKNNAAKRAEETRQANKDYDLLIAKGLRTEADRARAIAAINEKYKDPKPEKDKEAEKLRKAQVRDLERFSDLLEENKQKRENLTEAERVYMDVVSSEYWTKKSPQEKEEVKQAYEKAKADEIKMRLTKEQLELDNLIYASKAAALDLNFKEIEAGRKTIVDLMDQNEATLEQINLIGAETGATDELAKAKLRKVIAQKKELLMNAENAGDTEERLYQMRREIELLEEQVGLIDMKTGREKFVSMRDGIADAVVTGLFEGGKAGSQKLRDIITAELRKPITVFIQAVVSDILGLGGIGGGGIGGFANTIQQGTNLLSNFINFNSGLGSNLAFAADNLGSWLVNNTSGFMNKAGGSLMQNANLIGDIGGALGGAFSGYGISKTLSGGYQTGLGNTVDIIGAVASAFVGPIGGVISGLVNRAFGRKLKDTGLEGTFSGDSAFSGNTYQFYKGGWFSSNKTVRNPLDSALSTGLGQAYGGMTQANKQMASMIGLDSSRLNNFSSRISFTTQGMSEEQIQQKLQEVLAGIAEQQASILFGPDSGFIRYGEKATEALTRLSSSLKSVNSFLSLTDRKLLEVSLSGADMASTLVDLLGGVESFTSVTSTYYQNFFTEQERLIKGQELLANTFKEMNIQLPSTVSAYRQLVESQDLTTQSGRETFASLMSLSAVFYELDTASREAVSTIVEEINRLRGVVGTSSLNGFEGTRASFLSAIAASQAGDATARATLPGLSQSLETMFAGTAGSLEDVNRFRSWLANSLASSVPTFADGGIHSGGVRLVGENGPELEVTGPSRIFNAGDTAGMLSGGNVVDAIKVLNSNLELLRAEVRADVQHNAKTAKLLDRVIPEGDSINISGTIDGGQL